MPPDDLKSSFSTIGKVFDESSSSYKFYWFLAILRLVREGNGEEANEGSLKIRTDDLLIEMIAAAFVTVTFFKLTLGAADQLERVCRDLEYRWEMAHHATQEEIQVAVFENPELLRRARKICIYVPALFLSPWFESEMQRISAGTDRAKMATKLSLLRRGRKGAPPYWIEGKGAERVICVASEWVSYLRLNLGILDSFVRHALCRFLHTKNPGVPAITEKLESPRIRNLRRARLLWRKLIEIPSELRGGARIEDIYTNEPIMDVFSIDHFLPWSFVAHDQIWNLSPVLSRTNSAKGDAFPDLEKHLPALAKLHWHVIRLPSLHPIEQNEYASAFRVEFKTLKNEDVASLLQRYRDLVEPQLQIARNYGFRCDWKA